MDAARGGERQEGRLYQVLLRPEERSGLGEVVQLDVSVRRHTSVR